MCHGIGISFDGVPQVGSDHEAGDGGVPTEESVLDLDQSEAPPAEALELRQQRFQGRDPVRTGENSDGALSGRGLRPGVA